MGKVLHDSTHDNVVVVQQACACVRREGHAGRRRPRITHRRC